MSRKSKVPEVPETFQGRIVEDLHQRLAAILTRVSPALPAGVLDDWGGIQAITEGAAEGWIAELVNPINTDAEMTASRILQVLFPDHGTPTPETPAPEVPATFWGSPLGQLLVARNGFPRRDATRTEAASVLGFSVEWVRRMSGSGTRWFLHTRAGTTNVTRYSLMRQWELHRSRLFWAELHGPDYMPTPMEDWDELMEGGE